MSSVFDSKKYWSKGYDASIPADRKTDNKLSAISELVQGLD
jgi:hypothetical protein